MISTHVIAVQDVAREHVIAVNAINLSTIWCSYPQDVASVAFDDDGCGTAVRPSADIIDMKANKQVVVSHQIEM